MLLTADSFFFFFFFFSPDILAEINTAKSLCPKLLPPFALAELSAASIEALNNLGIIIDAAKQTLAPGAGAASLAAAQVQCLGFFLCVFFFF